MPQKKSDGRLRLSFVALLAAPGALVLACSDTITNDHHITNHYGDGGADDGPGAGAAGTPPVAGAGAGGTGDAGAGDGGDVGGAGGQAGGDTNEPQGGQGGEAAEGDPRYPDAPLANTKTDDLDLDLFSTPGNRYWLAVSEDQLKLINAEGQVGGGGCCGEGGIYQPGANSKPKWLDHLFVTTAGSSPRIADFGKVQASIVGQSSRYPWDASSIPNLDVDLDTFVEDQRLAGHDKLSFRNGQVGSIFRDRVATDIYRALGYPAPLAAYAWVQSNVWGPRISIPYTLVERYGAEFCARNEDELGGGCANLWQYNGDFNGDGFGGPKPGPIEPGVQSPFDSPESCQLDECDVDRAQELEAKLREVPPGDGFKAALADYVDWPAFHRYQCLSWVLSTNEDPLHNGVNNVLVERGDGKFQYLPHGLESSMSSNWRAGLRGERNALSRGCQQEASCWSDTLDVCEDVISELQALDPLAYLETIWSELEDNGMLRSSDKQNYAGLRRYFTERLENLPAELQAYRDGKVCDDPYVECNGVCVFDWQCQNPCFPPGGPIPISVGPIVGAGGAPAAGDVGFAGAAPVAGGAPIDCPIMLGYGVAP
jgi:CotH kinase protein